VSIRHAFVLALWPLAMHTNVHAGGSADARRAESLFRARCASCHSMACNRLGPKLEGVIGRRAGDVRDYSHYTAELRASGLRWSEQTLDQYLRDPGRMVPGTSMTSAGPVASAADRRDLIDHIKRQDRRTDLCPES
jgi:cytochrome c